MINHLELIDLYEEGKGIASMYRSLKFAMKENSKFVTEYVSELGLVIMNNGDQGWLGCLLNE